MQLLLPFATLLTSVIGCHALSSSNKAWAPSSWKFTLNIGRERGTLMPEEWGASGGRLALPLTLRITPDRPGENESEDDNGGGFLGGLFGGGGGADSSSSNVADPYMLKRNIFTFEMPDPTSRYIAMDEGEQIVKFGKFGGWKIRLPTGEAQGHAARFMCYMDLQTDVTKNDLKLEKGERIYLTAKCWREEELERATQLMKPIAQRYRFKQAQLEQVLDHESGDRRLDGSDPIETLRGMKDTAQLVIERDQARDVYEDARRVYPSCLAERVVSSDSDTTTIIEDLDLEEGPWPGQVEWLAMEPLLAMVRRDKLFVGEEYHIIGTWTATPILSEEDGGESEEPTIF